MKGTLTIVASDIFDIFNEQIGKSIIKLHPLDASMLVDNRTPNTQ